MRVFAVSKVGLDKDGRVTTVFWGKVNTSTNQWAAPEVVAPVADVVNAIHSGDDVYALFPTTQRSKRLRHRSIGSAPVSMVACALLVRRGRR